MPRTPRATARDSEPSYPAWKAAAAKALQKAHERAAARNLAARRPVPIEGGVSGGCNVSKCGDKPKREPWNKRTPEEAKRLRELLRDTKPADLADPSALQRIGRAIARAVYGLSKRDW